MHSQDDIRDRLEEMQRALESCDYYDPRASVLRGRIEALEWVLTSSSAGNEDPSESTRAADD
ncbi:hypothetical protein [Natrialba sp. PRR66]|uniref:hypothetical protein n=1 Tax=Natrialba sp. PRR66 TaxID=3098146 RepID=UPI002B1D72AC|nr:hypothetical protein [Natrialba sp. PRR66]